MDTQQLMQLERAAVDVMSPPYAVSAEKRREAEAIFLDFRKSKLPYEACKYILVHSQSDYVLFQAASTIKEGVIREWAVLSGEQKESLRAYIMHYITSRPDLVSYVREQLLHTVALMVKRATLEEDKRKLFDSVFSTVSQLLTMNSKMRQLGCSLLSALLSEYSTSSGSSNVGLPLEFHCQCKKAIEGEELLRILHFAVQALQQYLSVEWAGLSQEEGNLLGSFLQLTSQILNWDFRQVRFPATTPLWATDASSVPLRPPRLYAQTFLDPSFLELFFKLLGKVRAKEDQMHHVVQSLTQLASLTRPVFTTDEEQQSYVRNFISGILAYVSSSPDLNHQEVYGLSCILRRLACTFPSRHFAPLGANCLGLLIQTLAQLTVLCAQRTVKEEEYKEDSLTYQESLEHFLEVWVCLLEEAESFPPALLLQPSIDVFQAYVQSKLSAPRGWRTIHCDDEEIVELVEDDRTAYADQLCSIGYLSRTIAEHSLPLLVSLLEQCTSECTHIHELIHQDQRALFNCQNDLDSLYEDLHWLTLIAGYTLCDIVRGEDVLIPTRLMQHSIARQPRVQMADLDIRTLVLQEGGGEMVSLSSLHLDPIVTLILAICRLCVLEKLYISHGLLDVLSPQVCESTVWCLSRVAEPYLMLSEESYEQLSLPLLSVFGQDSESAHWLVAFLLEKVTFNLSVWSAEKYLTLTTTQLLRSIVKSPTRAAVAMRCEVLWSLMRGFSSGHAPLSSLPPSVQRELMSGLVMCGAGEQREQFLAELLQPLHHRFTSLVQHPDLQSHSQDGSTQQALLAILESLCGLAQSARPDSVPEFFGFMFPFLQVAVSLLEVFSDVVEVTEVILELFALVSENYTVFLNEAHTTQLYEVSLGLIQTYAKCNTGKYSRVALAEEEQCEDLLLFMRILTHLTSKDFLDFGNSTPSAVQPVDVVITGINIILPLINEEILKFPSLCQQFYTLIRYICDVFPEKVAILPEKLFIACMQLLEAGISNYGADICKLSLESIESVAVHYSTSSELHIRRGLTQSLQHFLKMLFELMLSSSFDMDLIGPASGATFALICAQKEYYSSLAGALVSGQSDPQNHSRLAEALHRLTPPSLKLDHLRSSKLQFRKNLEAFLPFVKGFLFYR